jgi:multimeric flavodoxin WrbA
MRPAPAAYDDLSAVFLNCTLTRSPATSHTQHLLDQVGTVLERAGASVEHIRLVDHPVAFGMSPDMTELDPDEGGTEVDAWPAIHRRIMDADIVVIGTPIWLGEKSSVATLAIERLYSASGETNERGQYLYYGKVGGAVVTGNEDGVKHCAASILYGLGHIGFTIPPQADAGWLGEIGPGPSYGDEVEGQDLPVGFGHDFTMKNATFLAWNLLHAARMLRDAGGYPAHGNVASEWDDGERWGFPDPR